MHPLILSFLAGMATFAGALISVIIGGRSEKVLGFSLGLSGGMMLFVSFAELIPKSSEALGNTAILLTMSLGCLAYSLFEILSGDSDKFTRLGRVSAAALALHNFPEGIVTFLSGNTPFGYKLALTVGLHNVPEGLSVAMPLLAGKSPFTKKEKIKKALLTSLYSGLAEPFAAMVTFLFFPNAASSAPILPYLFSFIAGMMSSVSLGELIPSAAGYGFYGHAGMIAGVAMGALTR